MDVDILYTVLIVEEVSYCKGVVYAIFVIVHRGHTIHALFMSPCLYHTCTWVAPAESWLDRLFLCHVLRADLWETGWIFMTSLINQLLLMVNHASYNIPAIMGLGYTIHVIIVAVLYNQLCSKVLQKVITP